MSEQSIVDPTQLRARAGDFDNEVAQPLHQALQLLQGAPRTVAFPNFSTVGAALATAYVEALHYAMADLHTKTALISEFGNRLISTAETWETVEDATTVETEGER